MIRRLGAAAVVAALLALLLPPAARADFGTPKYLTTDGIDSRSPRVATNSRGDVLIAWWYYDAALNRNRTRVTLRPGDGSPARSATLSPAHLDSYPNDVALSESGVGYVVMEAAEPFTSQAIYARTITATATGPWRVVAPPTTGVNNAFVNVDGAGVARLIWTKHGDDQIVTRTMSAASVLGPVVEVTPIANLALDSFASPVPNATAANGQTVVAWRYYDDGPSFIQARMILPDGTLGPVRTMSQPPGPALEANVCIDADGDAVVTWEDWDDAAGAYRVKAATLSKTSVKGTAVTVSAANELAIDEANVATDGAGGAMVVYESFTSQTQDGPKVNRLKARRFLAGGTLGPVIWVSPGTHNASFPYIATTGTGQYTLVWTGNPDGIRIQGRSLTLAGTLGRLQNLSPYRRIPAAHTAAGAPGHAVAAWVVEPPGSSYRVQLATSP